MSSHDAMMVASGITTVLDAVAIGDVRDGGDRLENLEKMVNAVEETQKRGLNRAEHRLHLRCELPHHTTLPLFEKLIDRESVSMVSLMDHSPGQRQYADRSKYRDYYQGKYHLTHDEMDRFEAEQMALAATWSQPNRQTIAAMCRARRIALASHDDATEAHVAESHQLGERDRRVSHHAGRGAGFTSARDARPDGGAEYRARRFPLRQRRRPPAGEPRFAGHPLI
ncbi:metal-dependent hydrolase [Klebsiella pneumoniae]|uniref:Metal-dependent hydrolase n=1 Tax=Klebsiella pneumoniae TaxID=573 RepID=A0A2X3CIK1_KLEPN|nr:metal-dependent hydrolase [Klebsiella pneumoniae]